MRPIVQEGVLDLHEHVRIELKDGIQVAVAAVFQKLSAVQFHDLVRGKADFQRVEMSYVEDLFDLSFHVGIVLGKPKQSISDSEQRKEAE